MENQNLTVNKHDETLGTDIDFYNHIDIEENYEVKYSYDDILTMLCGTQYYSNEEILYVYLVSNGLHEEAEHVIKELAAKIKHNQRMMEYRLKKNKKIEQERLMQLKENVDVLDERYNRVADEIDHKYEYEKSRLNAEV